MQAELILAGRTGVLKPGCCDKPGDPGAQEPAGHPGLSAGGASSVPNQATFKASLTIDGELLNVESAAIHSWANVRHHRVLSSGPGDSAGSSTTACGGHIATQRNPLQSLQIAWPRGG